MRQVSKQTKRSKGAPGRNDLINKLHKRCGITKLEAKAFIKNLFEEIGASIRRGNPYEILGYGRFYISERRARVGRNPQTGAVLNLPSSKTIRFKVGRKLKAQLKD